MSLLTLTTAGAVHAQPNVTALSCEQGRGENHRYVVRDYGSRADLVILTRYDETVEKMKLVHTDYAFSGSLYRVKERFQVYISGEIAIVSTAGDQSYICRSI